MNNEQDVLLNISVALSLSAQCASRDSRFHDYHCRCYSPWTGACCQTYTPSPCQPAQAVPSSKNERASRSHEHGVAKRVPVQGLPSPDKPFRVVWNHPDHCEKSGYPLNLSDYGIIHNTGRWFIGDEIQLLYNTGRWPLLKNSVCKWRHPAGVCVCVCVCVCGHAAGASNTILLLCIICSGFMNTFSLSLSIYIYSLSLSPYIYMYVEFRSCVKVEVAVLGFPSGFRFRGRKAILNHAHALVSVCP